MLRRVCVLLVLVAATLTASPVQAAEPGTSGDRVLRWASDLVDHVAPADSSYDSTTGAPRMTWRGFEGATKWSSHENCAGFVTGVLMHALGLTPEEMRDWTGSTVPSPPQLVATILAQTGFVEITDVTQARAGDILAIDYPDDAGDTGHTAVLGSTPVEATATTPIVAGTIQYRVTVLDSSKDFHGKSDTRYVPGGTSRQGAGRGVMRLYVDAMSGAVTGYTWSDSSGSTYKPVGTYPLAIGRIDGTWPAADSGIELKTTRHRGAVVLHGLVASPVPLTGRLDITVDGKLLASEQPTANTTWETSVTLRGTGRYVVKLRYSGDDQVQPATVRRVIVIRRPG